MSQELPKIKISGVPEHFNIPWHIGIAQGIFKKHGVEVEFIEQKLGTGALLSMLKKDEVDLIVALTEGLVSDICQGSDVKLLGTYVESPLCWAISSGKDSGINSVEDLRGKKFGISRLGSGSHLMAYVLALQRGWDLEKEISFEIKGSFEQLRASVNDGSTDAFMWETFMTKPYHDNGEVKRVGDITTPWPCFMLAGRTPVIKEKEEAIRKLTAGIKEACELFHSDPSMPQRVAEKYGHKLEDAKQWYAGVHITGTGDISESALSKAISILKTVKVVGESKVGVNDLIDSKFAHLRQDIKSMKLYQRPELINYMYKELTAAGLSKGPIKYTDLIPFDQHHHYHGVEAVELCAQRLKINSNTRVVYLGSGLGGPARYLAGKYGCKVLAIELQHDLSSTASELTSRCGLSHLVHHVAGSILQIGQHLQSSQYDSVISWLTVLHIHDRKSLFDICEKILAPGGTFYAEDFYELKTLSPSDREILLERVFCSYLPGLPRYKQDLEKSGFSVVEDEDLTDDWREWTKTRVTNFVASKERNVSVIGEETYNGLAGFYTDISNLFQGGNLGGIRIIAKKSD